MFLVSTNLLQDSIDKDGVHHYHEAYKFPNIYIREDIQTNWIYDLVNHFLNTWGVTHTMLLAHITFKEFIFVQI